MEGQILLIVKGRGGWGGGAVSLVSDIQRAKAYMTYVQCSRSPRPCGAARVHPLSQIFTQPARNCTHSASQPLNKQCVFCSEPETLAGDKNLSAVPSYCTWSYSVQMSSVHEWLQVQCGCKVSIKVSNIPTYHFLDYAELVINYQLVISNWFLSLMNKMEALYLSST